MLLWGLLVMPTGELLSAQSAFHSWQKRSLEIRCIIFGLDQADLCEHVLTLLIRDMLTVHNLALFILFTVK